MIGRDEKPSAQTNGLIDIAPGTSKRAECDRHEAPSTLSDTADRINYTKMERILELAFATSFEFCGLIAVGQAAGLPK